MWQSLIDTIDGKAAPGNEAEEMLVSMGVSPEQAKQLYQSMMDQGAAQGQDMSKLPPAQIAKVMQAILSQMQGGINNKNNGDMDGLE